MTVRKQHASTPEDGPPHHVRLIQDFINTREPQTGEESLQTPQDLRAWLVDHGLTSPHGPRDQMTANDLELAHAVREGLRVVLMSHTGSPADDTATTALNHALQRLAVNVEFDSQGQHRLAAAHQAPGHFGLAAILEAIRQATADQTWHRLKVCARDTCKWAFYDTSRNRAGRWCSMAGCGNHVKMQRAYAARKTRGNPER
jgi:predicted RNA-binding Zn ribbon-like protein